MKHIKRIISLCLILCICISGVQVSADNRYTEQSLEIESVSGTETYMVLNVDNRIYMSASDFGKITRYEYKEGPDNVLYTLGDKFVSVSKNEGKLSLPMQNYSTKCSKTVSYNGNTYIAMDELLPWLNVECSVADNKLIVASDAISMWELTDVLINNFETYKFNLYKDLGETNASSVGLVAAMMFDTILNVRFDRLIPGGDSIFDSEGSLYDRECYRDLYIEMATDDTLASAQADKVIKKVFEINGNIGTIEEAFGVDAEEIRQYGDSYLAEFGIDEELSNKLDFLTNDWLEVRKALKGASKASKYFNPFKILKSYETALHTTNEYRDYLKDITYDSKQNSVMQTAIREASLRLDESKGAVISAFIDLGHELVVGKTEDTFEKIIETAFEGKSLGSIFLYLDLAKIFYSTIVPVADGMSEMSKFIIYSNVSDYSWDKAYEYAGKELTQDNISFMCQSYIASLKSSKKAFEGMQTLFDSKAFGFSIFGNNEGLMDYRIDPTEEMLAKLALTTSCRENDSTENKYERAKEIQSILSLVILNENSSINDKNNEYDATTPFSIDDICGLWSHSEYPSNYSVLIFDGNEDTATVSIEAVRGNGAQIATASIENVKFTNGRANFHVSDSFGNIADCCINIQNGQLTLTYSNVHLKEYANWSVVNSPEGHYVKNQELSEISTDMIEWKRQEIRWSKEEIDIQLPTVTSDDYLRTGMYYQLLGKETYDPKIGLFFKIDGTFAKKNYDNASYFDEWRKNGHSGFYKVMSSDMEGYDFRLELDYHILYVKSIEGKDRLDMYSYYPNDEHFMDFYGTYLSEKYITDNGYTVFDWSGIN